MKMICEIANTCKLQSNADGILVNEQGEKGEVRKNESPPDVSMQRCLRRY